MQFISFTVLWKRIKAIKYYLKDPGVSLLKKLLVVFGIGYLFMPFDLIPIVIPVFGMMDDVILWSFILTYLSSELDKYSPDEKRKMRKQYDYSGKTIIQTTAREVDEKDEPGNKGGA